MPARSGEREEKMSAVELSTIGCIFGWGVETVKGVKPNSFKEIEECISVSGVDLTADKLDATPLKSRTKKYVKGHEDTGGELPTTFNYSDTFEDQWNEMYAAYETAKAAGLAMWFTVYHPDKAKANFYIVEPGSIPAPEYAVGNVLQVTINNTLVDLPDASEAIMPTPVDKGVSLNKSIATVRVGDTVTLTAETIPAGATVTWASLDADNATVSGGTVTGVSEGTATITASITEGGQTHTARCIVTVLAAD